VVLNGNIKINKMKIKGSLHYGQEGLFLKMYNKDNFLGKIILSKDPKKMLEFLGLSYERYQEGFDELVDIFKFISASPYFNWEKVQLENNNKVNRDRDKKRNTYQEFLKWIDENVRDDAHNYQTEKDKTLYYDMINEAFPEANLQMEVRRLEYEYCKELYVKSKFNGGEVMRKYGLQGKELGDAMNTFKKINGSLFPNETYEDYIIKTPVNEIYDDFELFLKK
jgi:hypothetical protein